MIGKVLIGTLLVFALFVGSKTVDSMIRPAHEVAIAIPGAVAYMQVWKEYQSDGLFRLVVKSPKGAVSKDMWQNWGPATRANFYLTPDNHLAVLGPSGLGETLVVATDRGPIFSEPATLNSELWTYIGATDRRYPGRGYRFYSPQEMPECLDRLGDPNPGRYRVKHEAARC